MKKNSYKLGISSEKKAIFFLKLKGYKILKQRFQAQRGTNFGEIDIIAEKKNTIHFIEVKKRKTESEAMEAITNKQQQRIGNSAELYLRKNPIHQNKNCQFDAIIFYREQISKIKHIKNCWLIT